MKKKKILKNKDFPGNLIKVNFSEQEIKYAKSPLQEHDIGIYILQSVGWNLRLTAPKGIEEDA